MYISLRWGGGGAKVKVSSIFRLETFDTLPLMTGSRGRRFTGSSGTPRVHWAVTSVTNLEFLFTLYKVKTRPNPMKGGVTMCRRAPRA